ncbi:GNAT family N-acetyltransferase [Macrococcus sp. DPC7161]|uniref:GNAT family N-acetyltransferase n=1 Tax=Macrococcus sp. DPC7161 TaxID=2507060 RepID=UPI0013E90B6A|nr:GNAT family N-acetyltransferase [Macrococcus sp. DPC7161]
MELQYLYKNNDKVIKQIAHIHEHIPYQYDQNYETNALEIALRIESMKLLLAYNDEIFYVTDGDDNEHAPRIIAYIWYTIDCNKNETFIYIKSTYVHPDYRQQGYATLLKDSVKNVAIQKGINRIESKVHKNNISMRQLNLKLGYKIKDNIMYLEVPHD